MSAGSRSPRILVLTGGLIHLVHQLAVANTLVPEGEGPSKVSILITGVLRRKPEALSDIHGEIGAWLAVLRQRLPERYGGVHLVEQPEALGPGPWQWGLVNNQWLESQRQVIKELEIGNVVVCGDGLGVYYRCARELRALAPSLLGLPIPEPGRTVRYVLSGRQPRWHRPPLRALPVPLAGRRELFDTLVEALRERGQSELEAVLRQANPRRPLWLCSVPNLAHQFPGERIPQEVLRSWGGALQREGFNPGIDQLQLMDHPKAPSGGSFGPVTEPWLAPPLRSSLPLELLIALLEEARPEGGIVVCGMTSALYGVRALTGATVRWLGLAPLWWFNPLYRQQPLEFLHRGLRKARMEWLTRQLSTQRQ